MDYLNIEVALRGYKYLLIIDHFIKLAVAEPTWDQTTESVAQALLKKFIVKYDCPDQLHSDQGACSESKVIEEMCHLYQIHKTRATPQLYPASDFASFGTTETRKVAQSHRWTSVDI